LREAASVIAVSRHVQGLLPVENTVVIPNVVDLPSIEKTLGALASSTPDGLPERFILFVGKLEPNKAPDRLLPVLRESAVGLPLVIAGTGHLEAALQIEAERSGTDVRRLGWVSEGTVLSLMKRATAVLFPSRWDEPLSRVLLEGLGVGAVLIVEPTGGSEEIVVDGESGLLARSVQEMAAALRRVVDDPDLASRLRLGALARARDAFSEEAVVPRIEALYTQVLNEAR
jgi:glycosyltransferase involved in cell wall biosynthesis